MGSTLSVAVCYTGCVWWMLGSRSECSINSSYKFRQRSVLFFPKQGRFFVAFDEIPGFAGSLLGILTGVDHSPCPCAPVQMTKYFKTFCQLCRQLLQLNMGKEDKNGQTAEKTFTKFKNRQQQKFERLRIKTLTRDNVSELNLRQSWVKNLSKRELTSAEVSVLSKGPHFALVPKVYAINFAAPIEGALIQSEATDQEKELARI